jgi:hypothetical protein
MKGFGETCGAGFPKVDPQILLKNPKKGLTLGCRRIGPGEFRAGLADYGPDRRAMNALMSPKLTLPSPLISQFMKSQPG